MYTIFCTLEEPLDDNGNHMGFETHSNSGYDTGNNNNAFDTGNTNMQTFSDYVDDKYFDTSKKHR